MFVHNTLLVLGCIQLYIKRSNVYNYFAKFIHTCTGILVPVRVPVSSSIKRYIRYQPKINERIIFYCRRVYMRRYVNNFDLDFS